MNILYDFQENEYVYCTRIPGIHRIVRVFKENGGKTITLHTEILYNSKYEKVLAKARDREYVVDASYCKPVDFKAMLSFEFAKFEKVRNMVHSLGYHE